MSHEKPSENATLHRTISWPMLVLYGLGTMLGAGIYALIGEVAGAAGAYAPMAFLLAAFIAGLTGASFAEFASRYPISAGEAVYVSAGFSSDRLAMIVGVLIVSSGVVSSGVMFRGFVGYSQEFFHTAPWVGFAALAIAIGGFACWGIAQSVLAIAIITIAETAALVLIIGLGLGADSITQTPMAPPGEWNGAVAGVIAGAVLAFYAFIGFEDMVNLAEEVKRPRRTVPIAIFSALAVTTVIYVLVAWTAVRTTPLDALAQSHAPMTFIYSNLTHWPKGWVSAIAMIAVLNGALVQVVMASRVLYGLANRKWLPSWFGEVYVYTRTPVKATLFVTALVFTAALFMPLAALAQATSFFLLIVFTLVNLALIRVKAAEPEHGEIFTVPIIIPWLGATSAAGFATLSLVEFFR